MMAFDVPSIYTAIGALVFAINTNTLYYVEDVVKSNFTNHLQESRRDVLLYRSKRSISEKTCRDMNRCGTFYRKCHCDDLCHDYKDCCWDAPNMSRHDSSERSCIKGLPGCFFTRTSRLKSSNNLESICNNGNINSS